MSKLPYKPKKRAASRYESYWPDVFASKGQDRAPQHCCYADKQTGDEDEGTVLLHCLGISA